MIRIAVLTASDKCSAGERSDESGSVLREMIEASGAEVADYVVIPDDRLTISSHLIRMADQTGVDLILTTGGTGFSQRDITPEATLDVIERQVPGIPEAMRSKSLAITNTAMLSRAVAGIRNKTLIVNLPGSPKAVRECLEIIMPVLPHAIQILKGQTGECARK
jgi:molybdopterin adenylyltransferase